MWKLECEEAAEVERLEKNMVLETEVEQYMECEERLAWIQLHELQILDTWFKLSQKTILLPKMRKLSVRVIELELEPMETQKKEIKLTINTKMMAIEELQSSLRRRFGVWTSKQ